MFRIGNEMWLLKNKKKTGDRVTSKDTCHNIKKGASLARIGTNINGYGERRE